MNIPIYRAKKIGSDEYVEGFYIEDHGVASYIQESKYLNFIVSDRGEKGMEVDTLFQIDPTTLAIHFSDMLDSNGNKIFASLQEDGKGGDIVTLDDRNKTVIYDKKVQAIMLNCKNFGLSILSLYKEDIKVIGIQE